MPFPQYLDPGLMNHTASYSGVSSNDEFQQQEHSEAPATFQQSQGPPQRGLEWPRHCPQEEAWALMQLRP